MRFIYSFIARDAKKHESKTKIVLVRSFPSPSQVVRASKDQIVRGISENGQVSILVANSTGLVTEAATRHRTAPTATAALGRALTGALLMGVFRKEGESLQINFNGRGMLGQMTVIADWQGNVKGMVQNPLADPPLKANGKLDVVRIFFYRIKSHSWARPGLTLVAHNILTFFDAPGSRPSPRPLRPPRSAKVCSP